MTETTFRHDCPQEHEKDHRPNEGDDDVANEPKASDDYQLTGQPARDRAHD
jgi:hypothetical protein